jgi:transcriptional regulator with XRE-family HTH domain
VGDDDQSNGEERPFKEIGERLRLLREVVGLDQRSFADRAGLAQSTYNQYEMGVRRPAIENAIALCEAYNVSLDWIYRGDLGGLRHQLALALSAAIEPSLKRERGPQRRCE